MDTLYISDRLQGVGMNEAVAKELANIIGHDGDQTATKADIAYLDSAHKEDIARLDNARKADVAYLDNARKEDIAYLDNAHKEDIARLDNARKEDTARMEKRIDRLEEKVDRSDEKIDRRTVFIIAIITLGFTVLGVLEVYTAFIR